MYSVCICLWSEPMGEFLVPFLGIGSVVGLYFSSFRAAFLDSLVVKVSACHVDGPDLIPGREVIFLLVFFSDLVLLEPLAGLPDLILRVPADLSHLV